MNWQPYPTVKPPKAGLYLAWESIADGLPNVAYYTKALGFDADEETCDQFVTHWCEIVPPSASATFGAVHHEG
jgi:hypothetical protein